MGFKVRSVPVSYTVGGNANPKAAKEMIVTSWQCSRRSGEAKKKGAMPPSSLQSSQHGIVSDERCSATCVRPKCN